MSKKIYLSTGAIVLSVVVFIMVFVKLTDPIYKFKHATRDTSEIRVYYAKEMTDERIILTIENKEDIDDIIRRFDLIYPGTPRCKCFGGGSLVFYSGEIQTCFLEITCQGKLRWREGWNEDYAMSDSLRKYLQDKNVFNLINDENSRD